MTIRTNTPSLLDNPPVPVQAKLAAAWTSFMFLYIYVDLFDLYKPGVVDGILNGLVWRFDVSSTLLTIMLASVAIPALMVMLSMTLPVRVNRATNLGPQRVECVGGHLISLGSPRARGIGRK